MIAFNFRIRNPFKYADFENFGVSTGPICENKSWEIQFMRYAYNIFEINVDLNWYGEDHAGPSININLFGYQVTAKIYDHRHWNYDTQDWEVYEKVN